MKIINPKSCSTFLNLYEEGEIDGEVVILCDGVPMCIEDIVETLDGQQRSINMLQYDSS